MASGTDSRERSIAYEIAQGLSVVQRVFQRLVGKTAPLLQAVNAGNAIGWRLTRPLVGYTGSITPACPRHGALHLG